MNLTARIRDAVRAWLVPEVRTSLENPSTPLSYPAEWLLDIFNGGRTDAGLRVSEMTALQVTTVFACVQLVASTMGALPLHVFELLITDKRPGKRVAYDHAIYDLLRWEPNPEMTAYTFRQTLQSHMLLWGNGYAEIQRDQGNRVIAIWPRNPARTRPYRTGRGTLVYRTSEGQEEQTQVYDAAPPEAAERVVDAEDMIHIPGLALDGRFGQSTVQLARQAIGLALATEKFGSKYFGNGARPGGILEVPGKMTPENRDVLRRSWQEAQGGENAHRVAILEAGMKWQEGANKPEEAQFLETRKYQTAEICRVFRVPPHMVGETERTNRANTEQIALEFLTYCVGPWIEAWEQETRRKLFPGVGRAAGRFFPKFETRRLTMPDAESRRNFYASGKQWGYLSTNDIHEFEDLNPVDDPAADAYWMPINMQEMGSESPAEVEPSPDLPSEPSQPSPAAPESQGQLEGRLIRAYSRIFGDAMRRILARKAPDAESFRRDFGPILASLAEQLEPDQVALEYLESSGFTAGYFEGLARRVNDWRRANGGLDQVVERELAAAIKAIRGALCEIST